MTLNCSSAPPAIDSDVRGLDSRRAHANGDLKAPSHHTYRPDIDGLRAIAVLSVVIFHAFPARFAGGFIGVDMFFVISGFLISSIIFNGLEQNNFSFVSFFSRRIKRIFPGLILVLLASLLFGWFALLPDEYRQLGKHIASGAGFIANFVFWGESGYFDNVAETKPLLHLWSLGIEEQFYLVWPFILWIAWGWRLNILGVTLGIFAVSFALNVWTVHWDTVAAFYSPQTRFWELLAGSILAYTALYRRSADTFIATSQNNRPPQVSFLRARKSIRNKICCALSILGVALILIGFSIVSKEQRFPGWWAMLPTAGTIMIISAGTKSWLNHQFLSNRVLVWFGLISFPLYLWHWPLLAFCRIVEGGIPSPQVRIAAILTSIGLAWLTFTFVEKPIRRFKHDRMAAFVLLLFLVFTGFGGFVCYEWGGFKYRSSLSSTSLNEAINAEFVGPLWKYTKNDLCQERYPFKESAEYSWWFCMANKDENPSLLLLGNSFAKIGRAHV